MTDDRINKILQRYFDFCTNLIKRIPPETIDADALMMQAFGYRDELEREIIQNEISCKHKAIKEIEKEINQLKSALENKN
ncbi:MAG TPA: hypothetical protein VNB90_13835 [Cytophagaceae bacterium]|jgi:hypothetical protein|nr:hypothetical protein [Cytophagaceae bacterium]